MLHLFFYGRKIFPKEPVIKSLGTMHHLPKAYPGKRLDLLCQQYTATITGTTELFQETAKNETMILPMTESAESLIPSS